MKSKIIDWVLSFSYVEMVLVFVFLLFVVLPISIPRPIAMFFDSSLGMALLFFATLFFFLGTHPLLGVLFIFVAYEILRRSSLSTLHVPLLHHPQPSRSYAVPKEGFKGMPQVASQSVAPLIKEGAQPVVSQDERDSVMESMNPPVYTTLEEEIVSQFGPVDSSNTDDFSTPSFSPVAASKVQGSLFI